MTEQWIAEWDEAIEAVGGDFSGGEHLVAADLVEPGQVRTSEYK